MTEPATPTLTDDDRLNEQIHQILREAAEKREARSREQAAEDTYAAKRQLDAVVTLARAQSRVARRWPTAPGLPDR